MSVIQNNLLLTGDDAYNLTRSLRFRSSASAYLNRTPASNGNSQKGTFSFWIKRSNNRTDGEPDNIYQSANSGNSNYRSFIYFGTNGGTPSLQIYAYDSAGTLVLSLSTSALYRDPSSWYHVVFAFDTTQATSSDRAKVYVNGSQITAFSTATYPSQNTNLGYFRKLDSGLYIGSNRDSNSPYADCYLTEYNAIDGQQLTPSSFGSTNAQTGVWQPARYTGTYGTNGFYLPFTDNSALTSGSNAGLGKDFSGNGNYWNTNNISITSGSTYDSMTDVPTLTSATQANYCVWNPLAVGTNITTASGNLNASASSNSNAMLQGTFGITSGKWYWEVTLSSGTSAWAGSIIKSTAGLNYSSLSSGDAYSYSNDGSKYNGQSSTGYGNTYTTNDTISVAYNADTGKIWYSKNGTWQASGDPAAGTNEAFSGISGTYMPSALLNSATGIANFGQRPFAYTPPTGFVALNTYNLPTPTIGATASTLANKNFDVSLWTGNSSSPRNITNDGGFQPDLVWSKVRNDAYGHMWFDSVRGAGGNKELGSNSTGAEGYASSAVYGYTSSFNSNGFTVTAGTDGSIPNAYCNQNSLTYVGWQWKGGGSAVSNTAGSITSQVSANTSAGFSVVTYTGNGSGGATVGHGLGVAPKMIIVKRRDSGVGSTNWLVYHSQLNGGTNPAQYNLKLNLTNAQAGLSSIWNDTAPTSSVFSLGSNSETNGSGGTFVAYCFSEIAGYSKFGSYTGNGSTDGTFVHLGFRPKYVMIKLSSNVGEGWILNDTSRSPYNVCAAQLQANSSGAEVSGDANTYVDILSNGFKIRTTAGSHNTSGYTYIYLAFAENPFKYSLAR